MNKNWININEKFPIKEGYYRVKYPDGSEDRKPFRNRTKQGIIGFVTEKEITHWK